MTKPAAKPPGVNARILKSIRLSGVAPSARMIADASGVDCRVVSRNLGKLQRDGLVEHAPGSGKGVYTTWAIARAKPKGAPKAAEKAAPWVGQVAPPRDKAPSKTLCEWAFATPARPGATDHERIPSRRGDHHVAHRPLMLMGSRVRTGEFGK